MSPEDTSAKQPNGAEQSLEGQARNPSTSPHDLQYLAANYSYLRPLIAGNPNAYPGLLTWLGQQGDPAVDAALAARNTPQESGATEVMNATSLPEPSVGLSLENSESSPVFRNTVMPSRDSVEDLQQTQVMPSVSQPVMQPNMPPQMAVPPQPAVVPGFAPALPGAGETQPSKGGLPAIIIVLIVIAVAAVAVTVYLVVGGGKGKPSDEAWMPPAGQSSPSALPTPSESPTPSVSPTPSETPKEILYPAPPSAVAATWFVSPSGNIACQMSNDQVQCTIFENKYSKNGYQTCGNSSVSFVVSDSGVAQDCSLSPVSSTADVLVYNTASAIGDYACVSSEGGMNCWNTVSGQGFVIAREGWITDSNGAIPYSNLPWR